MEEDLMSQNVQTGITQTLEQRFGVNRSLLMGVGLGCILLGLVALVVPVRLFSSLMQLVGILLLVSAGVKSLQLLLGLRSVSARERGWPLIVLEVVLDVCMGLVLLNHGRFSAEVLAVLFGLLFALEGIILLYIALRSPTVLSRNWIALCGLATFIGGLVISLRLVEKPLAWAGFFVGFKLVLFGLSLFWIAWRAMRKDSELLYEAGMPTPERAELYAVYFGTAFHLGVYIGDEKVVHYLNDNQVYQLTWEEFLLGRIPQHWTYPDLPLEPADEVVKTALAEVGKSYKYDLLKFNCEHFAVFCKSGGKTSQSNYAQSNGGLLDIGAHPVLGTIAEMNTRFVEWLAFHFGGPAGKKVSLLIRRLGATVTTCLVWLGSNRR
jgi:uncharacterized membrane protein HdeD (DUF308 family)